MSHDEILKKIDEITLDTVRNESRKWKVGDDYNDLIYVGAYIDGILDFSSVLKESFNEQQPEKFEVDDESNQGTNQSL
ncbi:MAG: hypothetical protein IKE94_04875 [Aeriscardovia sp.]|nr:hypothetical protein [Aeriscardovia sp.]